MGLRQVIKKGISFGFQPKRWIGLDQVKTNSKVCVDLVSDLISKEKFDERHQNDLRKERLLGQQMSASELISRKRLALGMVLLYLVGGLGFIGYALYLGLNKSLWMPSCMSFLVSFLILTYALRELMVYGQIRAKRRITLKELFRYLTKGFPK